MMQWCGVGIHPGRAPPSVLSSGIASLLRRFAGFGPTIGVIGVYNNRAICRCCVFSGWHCFAFTFVIYGIVCAVVDIYGSGDADIIRELRAAQVNVMPR